MHHEAYYFIKEALTRIPPRSVVVEYGGRNINGTVKELFEGVPSYTSIDIVIGPGVDKLADAVTYIPEEVPDTVICCEVLEHSPKWPEIVKAAGRILDPEKGILLLTCATMGRTPHSGMDGGPVRSFEYYKNVDPMEMTNVLEQAGFQEFEMEVLEGKGDLQVLAWKKEKDDVR